MTDIELNPQGEVVLDVDRSIYDESVIDIVLVGRRLCNHPAKYPRYDHSDDRFLCPESDHAGDVR